MQTSYNESMHGGNEAVGMTRYGHNSMRVSHEGNGWDHAEGMLERFNADGIDMNRYGNEPGGYSYSRYRGQPRTASGRFKRMRFSQELEREKEELAPVLAEMYGYGELKECAIKEASELIKAASEGDEYAMFKEFYELCVIMKAFAELIPEEIEERAAEEAVEYYSRKVEHAHYGHERHPFDEFMRRSRRRYR
jgi:hypothetical protein